VAEGEEMKRIKGELLQPGDIVLTADSGKTSKIVRRGSKGEVSHAMICVQHSSIIDSTGIGVQARNIQRELYDEDARIVVLRLRERPSDARLGTVLDFARSEIGTRYSKAEAIRSVAGVRKPRTARQFCSRLVARAYASAGISLVADPDYCTPEEVRLSPMLIELDDMTEDVSEAELAAWAARPNPIAAMQDSQNAVLEAARRLDPTIENFNDLDQMVHAHPEWDAEIARAYRESGHLDLWRSDFAINAWHYDVDQMEAITSAAISEDLRSYCVSTISEFHTGGLRFASNLVHYRERCRTAFRETWVQLLTLYEQLVRNDALRRTAARVARAPFSAGRRTASRTHRAPLGTVVLDHRPRRTTAGSARAAVDPTHGLAGYLLRLRRSRGGLCAGQQCRDDAGSAFPPAMRRLPGHPARGRRDTRTAQELASGRGQARDQRSGLA